MCRDYYYPSMRSSLGWFTIKAKKRLFLSFKAIKNLYLISLLFSLMPRVNKAGLNFRLTSGYTMLELIAVIMIMGILASFVVVDQVRYYNRLSFIAEVEKFIGDIEYARDYAISRRKQCVITTNAGNLLTPPGYSFSLQTADGTEDILLPSELSFYIDLPDGASLNPADNEIVLDIRGTPDGESGDVIITYSSTTFSQTTDITLNDVTGFITQ